MKESALATLLKNGTYSNNELASAIGIWCHVKSNGVTSIHDGLVARRILCYTQEGDRLERGQRYGFIRFGSRVDVYLPTDAEVKVTIGDKVTGVLSTIARI